MDKKYDHLLVEKDKNQKWIEKEYFSTHDKSKETFSILLPPPNVTGKLHLGHAWDVSIQDSLIRFNKLMNKDVMWIPGMDHAGIATQAKVEQRLRGQGISRYDLGREKFLDKVWEWKEEYAETIRSQWGKLGLALDYKKERFTMDDGLSTAVQQVFIDMHSRGLIYKGERAISWDPALQTVLSNIEVINKDTTQKMYYIKYDLKDGGHIEIATVRTETLFADVAIAVNPSDEKFKDLVGKVAIHPLTKKELTIITDDHIELGKGTGAMKVSAHAETDFEILMKNNLPVQECIDESGKMNERAMQFAGLDRFEAREKIAEHLEKEGRISKVEEVTSAVGYSERSGEPIEVLVQPQWFVKMDKMADNLLKDLDSKNGVKFFPGRFEDVLRKWMEDIRDWCISRQLWWGHRIPAWYKGEEMKVQIDSPGEGWVQDEDVLDTWFSSGIAPFSFLGWPEKTEDLARFYPTNTLVTGYDIIFFWVSRMYFQSLEFMDEKPFNHVLIHGLIRDEQGRKMSKSLGNGIDPMETVEKYGADALRWFLLTNSTPGQDIRYSTQKLESAWNLNNKLWNISRYIIDIMPDSNQASDADNWIIEKYNELEKTVIEKMETYEFTIIGKEMSKFIQESFSSWYIEFTKASPNKKVAKEVLQKLLVLLHPFMPFVSDHLYSLLTGKELLDDTIQSIKLDKQATYIDEVITITKEIRNFRTINNLSNNEVINYSMQDKIEKETIDMINQVANANYKENKDAKIPVGTNILFIELTDEMKNKEKERIDQREKFLLAEIKRAKGILSNERFVAKAPKEKVQAEKEKLAKFEEELQSLRG